VGGMWNILVKYISLEVRFILKKKVKIYIYLTWDDLGTMIKLGMF
jgi:hypothetical protein